MKQLFGLLCTILISLQLSADPGVITGTITDSDLGEVLIGAYVYLEGTETVVVTDFDGKYQMKAEPGMYTIKVTYIGFADKIIEEVEVNEDEVTYLDVSMSEGSIEIEEVVVTAKTIERSENALLLLQRKSNKIQDGISAQEMSKFSLGDAAAAMSKVPGATVNGGRYIYIRGLGDRYSLTMLNGLIVPSTDPYRNSAQLDLIPTNLLDNIITAKTFTPDQPGTFTGGNVNIKTKTLPEQFFLTISASAGINTQANLVDDFLTHDGGSTDWLGFDDGTRSFPEFYNSEVARTVFSYGTNLPIIARNKNIYNSFVGEDNPFFSSHADFANQVDRVANSVSRKFSPVETSTGPNHGLSISLGNQFNIGNNPLGIILSGSYKREFVHLDDYTQARWVIRTVDEGMFNQGDFIETLSTETPTVNGLFGLSYRIGRMHTVSFTALYNHSADKRSRFVEGERPDNIVYPLLFQGRSLVFQERGLVNFQLGGEHVFPGLNRARMEWKLSRANSFQNEPETRFFENDYHIELDEYEIPASNVQRPFHFFRDLEDDQYDAKLDFEIPLNLEGSIKLKVGGMYSQKERTFTENRYQVEEHLGVAEPYGGDTDVYLSDENYGIIEADEENSRYLLGTYIINATELRNSYDGEEKVTAAYGMLTLPVTSALTFIGGVRYEKTDLFVEGRDTFAVDTARIGQIDVGDFLPSLNLVYQLNDVMNLRASYTQTIARPNMREIAPFEAFDPLTKETYFGNTQLDRTTIQNVDLRWEWFMTPGELLAFSAYYKNFNDPIVMFLRRAPNPEIQFVNVPNANVYGIEVEFRKDLRTWARFLENFSFRSNFSLIRSVQSVRIPQGLEGVVPEERPFEGQSPFIVNVALAYSNPDNGIDATLALNTVGDRLFLIGEERTPDAYLRGRSQLDFTFIKKIGDLNIRLSAMNLLNDKFDLSHEYEGQEFFRYSFRRGVNFNASVSYTIK